MITGIGIVTSIGWGVNDFWEKCLEGKSVICEIPEMWREYGITNSQFWSPLPKICWENYQINKIDEMQLDTSQKLSLVACHQALEDAGFSVSFSNERKRVFQIKNMPDSVGVFLGTGIGGIKSIIQNTAYLLYQPLKKAVNENIQKYLETAPARFNPFAISMGMANACAARIGLRYSLKGPNRVYSMACASGTVAIGHAYQAIKSGEVDIAVAGGVEYMGDTYGGVFRGFDVAHTLVHGDIVPDKINRPFDCYRSGFLFSEGGCAILILEEERIALRRMGDNARIYAEILSYAETFDAYSILMIEPNGQEICRMIRNMLSYAGLQPKDIDYINAHGTGTQLNDEVESRVIDHLFKKKPLVNSTKSLIGHSIGASGAIEAVVSALSVFHKKTHICRNLEYPLRDLNFVQEVKFYPIKVALSHSFAFGGHNAGLIFSEFQ
ncbi:MAG: beta-ketoacyl-[acyl-carrier-protein] synthase family protein [bacterium]